jgi:branched-chain amino acid transport system substrate-binding protein
MNLGGAVVNIEYYSEGDTNFITQLESIAVNAPDVIYMPGFPPEVPIAINQARTIPQENATGITATFLGGDGWDFVELITMGGVAVEGSYYTAFYAIDSPMGNNKNFIDAYQYMFGTDPEVDAALGYDALRLIGTAIRRAGSLDTAAIRDELAETYDYRGATHIRRYDESRHPEKSIVIKCIRKGKAYCYQVVEP